MVCIIYEKSHITSFFANFSNGAGRFAPNTPHSFIAERIKNRTPRGASTEKLLPRPAVTSISISLFL